MAISFTYYGSLSEANDYFGMRLHERAWSQASTSEREKALYASRLIIDGLNFKGCKHTVYELLQSNSDATDEEIRAAEASQETEFPRGDDEEVPQIIILAAYEIAYSLLDGKDPEVELETLGIVSQGYGSVRTTYNRAQVPIEHLINGIPNALAWRWLRPFLRDDDAIKLSRVS